MKVLNLFLGLLIVGMSSCQSQPSVGDVNLDAASFDKAIKANPDAVILDVRTPGEYAQGFIYNARNIDYRGSSFQSEINNLDKSKTYFVYCLSGGRSGSAVDYMKSAGFTKVYNLKGGIMGWQGSNLPINTTGSKPVSDKISPDDYNKMINGDALVLIDFYAPWCAPCKKMEPMLEQISTEHAGKVKIIRLNVDENKQLAQQMGISEIPVFKLYNNGKETWMYKGYIEKNDLMKALGI